LKYFYFEEEYTYNKIMNLPKSNCLGSLSINLINTNIAYKLFFVVVVVVIVGGLLLIFGSNYDYEDIFYDAFAQDENNITIKTTKLTDSFYMLKGSGEIF